MAKTPDLPPQPKNHPVLSNNEETNERTLWEAEQENREFYTMNAEAARRVTDLQTGIAEDVRHALTRGLPAHALQGNLVADRVKEERVQTELYRAVQGNETYETELGEDSRHYLASENVQYLERNLPRRIGRKFHKYVRGAASMIGFNNLVEAHLNDRFGADRNIDQRRLFVANRLEPEIVGLPPTQLTQVGEHLAESLGITPPFPAMTQAIVVGYLARANLSELRNLREFCNNPPQNPTFPALPTPPIPLPGHEAYLDLMMIVDLDQRVSSKIALKEVYNQVPLRNFLNDLEHGNPPNPAAQHLKTTFINSLEPNSLWFLQPSPTKDNPDGIALVAELRSRIAMYVRTGRAPDTNAAYAMMDAEIQDIVTNEVDNVPRTQEEIDRIANLQRETSRIVSQIRQYLTELQTLRTRSRDIDTTLGSTPPPPNNVQRTLQAEKAAIQAKIAERPGQIQTLAQELENLFTINRVNHRALWGPQSTVPVLSPVLANPIEEALGTTDFLIPPTFINDLNRSFNVISNDVTHNINRVLPLEKARLTPFQLLQRFMVRDYKFAKEQSPSEYSEEANHYAAVKAALRVEDVKSIDRMRSANARAAEYMNRGLARRGWDRFKKAVSRSQDVIGLEAIDFSNMTAGRLLEQIIRSNPDFHVFKGINKFTTIRDLRKILNQSGDHKVPREVVERFAATLEEALNMYKKVPKILNIGVNVEDWDLEKIIEPLKKLKVELWTEDLLTQVHANPGVRTERTLVRVLRGCREREKQIDDAIHLDLTDEQAPWRVQLSKRSLKRMLDKNTLDGFNKIFNEGIDAKKHRIAQKEQEMNALPQGDSKKVMLQQEIETLQKSLKKVELEIAASSDLYDRVQKAREYIKGNKLSRREKKEYLERVGLTQVFDKMSQNFRMQDTWAATKRGAQAFWAGTTKAWKWSRKRFLNATTAKGVSGKGFSVMRLAATPVTAPLGLAWKAGTFPFRLVGRAMSRSVDAPWWLAGQVSGNSLRRFYRVRAIDEKERLDSLVTKRNNLIKKLENAPYSWDKKRIANKMNRLEERVYQINATLNDVRKAAIDNQVDLGEMATYSQVSHANGRIIIIQGAPPYSQGEPTLRFE